MEHKKAETHGLPSFPSTTPFGSRFSFRSSSSAEPAAAPGEAVSVFGLDADADVTGCCALLLGLEPDWLEACEKNLSILRVGLTFSWVKREEGREKVIKVNKVD